MPARSKIPNRCLPVARLWVAAAAWTLCQGILPAADWPQILGPEMNGISRETGFMQAWPADGPPLAWRHPIGEACAGIAVVGLRLYTMDSKEGSEYAVCLEAATGRELWRVESEGYYTKKENGSGPRSTPLVHDGKVYTTGGEGYLMCVDAAKGEKLWGYSLLEKFGGKAPARRPSWGYATSPMVAGGRIIAVPGAPPIESGERPGQSVVALDKDTGEPVWKSLDDTSSYSTPRLFETAGRKQLACFLFDALVGVSLEDGRELWRVQWPTQFGINVAIPLVQGDKIFASSAYDQGSFLVQLSPKPDGGVAAGHVWAERLFQNHFTTSILLDGYLYGPHRDKLIKCVEFATGHTAWQEPSDVGRGQFLYADGRIVVVGEAGDCVLIEPSPKGYKEISRFKGFSRRVWNVPALADGKLYARCDTEIACWDLRAK